MKRITLGIPAALLLLSACFSPPSALSRASGPGISGQLTAQPFDPTAYEKIWLADYPKVDPAEPRLTSYDEGKAIEFLDSTALKWASKNGCATCHTNVPYLMARPLMPRTPEGDRAIETVRSALVKSYKAGTASPLRPFFAAPSAAALVVNDALTTGTLSDDTSGLLDETWNLQELSGDWHYPTNKMLPFLEQDGRYVAYLVAVAGGYLPVDSRSASRSKVGLRRLRAYVARNTPVRPHDKALVLWAAARWPELLSWSQKRAFESELLKLQQSDGGWTLPALGDWPRADGPPNDPRGPSDGYATGLVTLALCSNSYVARDGAISAAIGWLKANQRVSGRWYARSPYSDQLKGYISNMATAYAVMAIKTCATK